MMENNIDYVKELIERDKSKVISYDIYHLAICPNPNCNHLFEAGVDEKTNFCPSCGQRLKWEEEKK